MFNPSEYQSLGSAGVVASLGLLVCCCENRILHSMGHSPDPTGLAFSTETKNHSLSVRLFEGGGERSQN